MMASALQRRLQLLREKLTSEREILLLLTVPDVTQVVSVDTSQ